MKIANKCYISRTVHVNLNLSKAEKILNNMMTVSVKNNKILNAIMKCQNNWLTNPSIFVDNQIYKLEMLEVTSTYAIMLQKYVYVYEKKNTKTNKWYDIINVRTVKIEYQ